MNNNFNSGPDITIFDLVKSEYDRLNNLESQKYNAKMLRNFTIKKDAASFILEKGEIYFLPSINNKNKLVLYLGKGKFHFNPPSKIEKRQLLRYYKNSEFEFKRLFLYCDDETIKKLKRVSHPLENIDKIKIKKILRNCSQYLNNKDQPHVRDLMFSILNNHNYGFFYAHISQDDFHPVFYLTNPYEEEEIRFMRRIHPKYVQNIPEVICQFSSHENYKKKFIDINHYYINCMITEELEIQTRTEMELELDDNTIKWIYFDLFSQLQVDSVFWNDGTKIPFYKENDSNTLWIYFDQLKGNSKKRKLIIHSRGDIFENRTEGIYLKSPSMWYPRHGGNNSKATYEIDFKYPKDLTLLSSGKNIYFHTQDEFNLSNWIILNPTSFVSFNIGYYINKEIKNQNYPDINIFIPENKINIIDSQFGLKRFDDYNDNGKNVVEDIVRSVYFFKSIFGNPPAKKLYIAESPFSFRKVFPGLIYLSQFTFQRDLGYDFIFRGREISYQWWGIGVDIESYHDQWITEGLSTFCGLWYLQRVLKQNEEYLRVLDLWKNEIINNRKYLFADGIESSPVWFGYRTMTSATEKDYNLLISKKSAWIFHMLRHIMLDFEEMQERKFRKMLNEVYSIFENKTISTKDLKNIIEYYTEENMDWFFKQWIYESDIPKYNVYYKILVGPIRKKFSVIFYVEQNNVNDDFQMYIPVCIEGTKNNIYRERFLVKGKKSSYIIPNLSFYPTKVIFNDFNAVLCDFNIQEWK
jgi:hypothetical protein